MKHFRPAFLIVLMVLSAITLPSISWGEMLDTGRALESEDARAQVLAQLDRAEVIEYLAGQGLSREEAASRINSLTDDEINALSLDIDQYAGGQFDDSDDGAAMVGVLIGLAILLCLTLCLLLLL